MREPFVMVPGDGPVIATAIHAGHDLRDAVRDRLVLPEETRLLEEDPYTELLCQGADTVVQVYRSRFEVDLNRPRDKAVYLTPEDAWGLRLWEDAPPPELVRDSLALYDRFYAEFGDLLEDACAHHGHVAVVDLHSYCHRRGGPGAAAADPAGNPDVNLGTGSLPEDPWRPLVERFLGDLRAHPTGVAPLTVGENVKFRGGHLSQWVHGRFPGRVCVLAVEFKKVFMDEWTGRVEPAGLRRAAAALRGALPGLRAELAAL